MRSILCIILFTWCLGAFAEPETFESSPTKERTYATGFKSTPGWSKTAKFRSALTALQLPRHFDWREQGNLTAPRDQGDCGSCWTYSTVAVLQDAISLIDKRDVDLSEQYLLSCNTKGFSCNGGDFIHDMHVNPGAAYEEDFPYVGKKVACKQGLRHDYRLSSWAYVPTKNESSPPEINEIKAAIYQYGPISAAVAVNDAFNSYRSGVFNKCDSTPANHAIVLVGWDDDTQSWILKNSWGTGWGEKGYMRIRYGCNYVGLEANYVVYSTGPTPGPNPVPTPTPTPIPIPKCTPQPIAAAGPTQYARRGQIVKIGATPLPGTSYIWEINGKIDSRLRTTPIRAQVFGNAIFTVYATTKCGTARSSMMVVVSRR